MATGYPYETVPISREKKEIRLLNFKVSNKTSTTSPVRCTVKTISLATDVVPKYFAISYTWGDATKRKEIEIDGHLVSIPENADAAVRYLRFHQTSGRFLGLFSKSEREIDLWLDVVCIDQSNTDERNWQVAMMGRVYGQAEEVVIWLGSGTKDAKKALDVVERIVSHCKRATDGTETLRETLFHVDSEGTMTIKGGDEVRRSASTPSRLTRDRSKLYLSEEQMALIEEIYSAAWFTRFWVVQEVQLAKRATCYYSKHKTTSWKLLLASWWLTYFYRDFQSFSAGAKVGMICATRIHDSMMIKSSLFVFLTMSFNFKTKERLDKIHAVLGLLPEEERQHFISAATKEPNYDKSVVEVYRDTTRAAICIDENLDILRYVMDHSAGLESESCSETFPSWVPRYDLRWLVDFPVFEYVSRSEQLAFETSHSDANILALQGAVIDQIAVRGPDFGAQTSVEKFRAQVGAALDEVWEMVKNRAILDSAQSLEEALAVTLACGVTITNEDARHNKSFHNSFSAFASSYRGGSAGAVADNEDEIPENEFDFIEAMYDFGYNRVLFISEAGNMGMASSNMQKGDKICHLFRGRVPFILRQEGANWRLLGDAYLYNLSNHMRKIEENWTKPEPMCFHIH